MFILWSDKENLNLNHFPSPEVIWAIHTVNLSFCQFSNCLVLIKERERVKKTQENLSFPCWPSLLMFTASKQKTSPQSIWELEMHEAENPALKNSKCVMISLGVFLTCWRGDCILAKDCLDLDCFWFWFLLCSFLRSSSWTCDKVF